MYHIRLPEEMMLTLRKLKQYYGERTIAGQVREAVSRYLYDEEEGFWDTMEKAQEREQDR